MPIPVQKRLRVHPSSHTGGSTQPKTIPLSILDATVLNYSTSGCIWFYPGSQTEESVHRLINLSLPKTLDAYPQWAGHLRFASYDLNAGHTHRQGRLELEHGGPEDQGVEVMLAKADCPMEAMIPSNESRNGRFWDATEVDYQNLLDMSTPFAPDEAQDPKPLPCMKIQLTTFPTGGLAIAIGLAHPLADAQTLLHFAHSWAATNLALSSSSPLPTLTPVFNPSLLDKAAAGDIDAFTPNHRILEKAAPLPLHRYDYWASGGPSCPEYALPATKIPDELSHLSEKEIARGAKIPWESWDLAAKVAHVDFFFSGEEVHGIYERAAGKAGGRISHLDALLAKMWGALIRARRDCAGGGLEVGDEHWLDVSIDVRRRVEPKLPAGFIGSPIMNVGIITTVPATQSPGKGGVDIDLGGKAANIRNTISLFTPTNTAALLHEMAFELGAQRRWNCFLGDKHVIVTSWVGIGLEDVVFEKGEKPVWVESILPPCEGTVQVMEGLSPRDVGEGQENGEREVGKAGEWWRNGVTLSVWLKEDVMGRLVEDGGLRVFGEV